tara:strand:+ start:443 stop:661 length:219 start_codon:yes stop_codon:yes gene_type:complete
MANRYKIVGTQKVQLTDAEEAHKIAKEKTAIEENKTVAKAKEDILTNKTSAINKLKTLGLSDDEISALTGAS